jgi:hypothetical protein
MKQMTTYTCTTLLLLSQITEFQVQGLTWFWFQSVSCVSVAFSFCFMSYSASPKEIKYTSLLVIKKIICCLTQQWFWVYTKSMDNKYTNDRHVGKPWRSDAANGCRDAIARMMMISSIFPLPQLSHQQRELEKLAWLENMSVLLIVSATHQVPG